MTGLSGTGKSAVATRLASARGMHVIASDVVRKELAGIPASEHRYAGYQQGLYATEQTARTYAALIDRARSSLSSGQSVILDATFQQRSQRADAFAMARDVGALAFCVETVADDEIVRQRLAEREHDPTTRSDARWETYVAQRRVYEPVNELNDWQHLRIDSVGLLDDVVANTLSALSARLTPEPFDTASVERH